MEMIACDSSTCPVEWFHLDCLGLSCAPEGEWDMPSLHRFLCLSNDFVKNVPIMAIFARNYYRDNLYE